MNEKQCLEKSADDISKAISQINRLTGIDSMEAKPVIDLLKETIASIKKVNEKISPPTHKEKRILNYTSHDVEVLRQDGTMKVYHPVGEIPRCFYREEVLDLIDNVKIMTYVYGDVTDLPDPDYGTYYIVSSAVASAAPNRSDLLVPGKKLLDSSKGVIGRKWLYSPNARISLRGGVIKWLNIKKK